MEDQVFEDSATFGALEDQEEKGEVGTDEAALNREGQKEE